MNFYNKVIKSKKILKRSHDYNNHMCYNFILTFVGALTQRGLKIKAYNKFLNIKYVLKKKEKLDPYLIFLVSFLRLAPAIFLFPMRMGRIVQGIPLPILQHKQVVYAVKWIIQTLKLKNKTLTITLIADLLISTAYNKGLAIEKKKEVDNIALKNRYLLKYLK